jgi:rare lipoprotein A
VTKTTITKKTVIKLEKKSKTSKRIQKNGKIKIQIGAFKNISGAKIFKEEFASFGKPTYIKEIDGKYKVFIYGFDTYQEAQNFKLKNDIKGFIVK